MVITLTSFGAVPDAREIRDAAVQAGSTTLISASAGFSSADEGKHIVVALAGAAGAKLRTTIDVVQSSTEIKLATPASSTPPTSTAAVYGADCGPALTAALTALISAKGGHLVIDGMFLLYTPVDKSFGNEGAGISVTISGTGTDSNIWIGVPATVDALNLTSGDLTFRDFSFVGLPLAGRDARRVLNLNSLAASFERCGFVGLLAGEGVLYATECSLATDRCAFGGTFVASDPGGLPRSVIENKAWRSYRDIGSSFIDYGYYRGLLYGKSGPAGTSGWVRADTAIGAAAARGEGVFSMEGTIMDEGALLGVIIKPSAGRIAHVLLDGLRQNVSPTANGRGVECHKVDSFTITRGWLGFSTTPQTLVGHWEDCGSVVIDSLRLSESVNRASAKNCASLTIKDTAAITSLALTNTPYRPVQSHFAPHAIVKEGPVSDADFIAPPALGTSGFDSLAKRRYEKGVTLGGWVYFDMDGGEVLGTELVVNGDMSSGTTGWTPYGGGLLSVVGGALRLTNGAPSSKAYQVVPTVVGQRYKFSGTIPGGDAGRLLRVGTSLSAPTYANFTHVGGEVEFVAASQSTYITMIVDNAQLGRYADFDSISLRPS